MTSILTWKNNDESKYKFHSNKGNVRRKANAPYLEEVTNIASVVTKDRDSSRLPKVSKFQSM